MAGLSEHERTVLRGRAWWTPTEAALMLRRPRRLIYIWISKGLLVEQRTGRLLVNADAVTAKSASTARRTRTIS